MTNPISALGQRLSQHCSSIGYTTLLFIKALLCLRGIFFRLRIILGQLYICGAQSVSVTLVVGAFTGMIVAFQIGFIFKDYHLEAYTGMVVMISLFKELGPFMTAFILAGRVGAAMAAELGTMAVSEEIDALETMSIDPVHFLVMPRILALALVAPVLTIFANLVGILGGAVVSRYQIGVDWSTYLRNIISYMEISDLTLIYGGLVKAMVFGLLIATVGCANGLRATRGAEGVGAAARKSVVDAFLLILMFNYFMSSLIEKIFGHY